MPFFFDNFCRLLGPQSPPVAPPLEKRSVFFEATTYFAFPVPYIMNYLSDWLKQGLKLLVEAYHM